MTNQDLPLLRFAVGKSVDLSINFAFRLSFERPLSPVALNKSIGDMESSNGDGFSLYNGDMKPIGRVKLQRDDLGVTAQGISSEAWLSTTIGLLCEPIKTVDGIYKEVRIRGFVADSGYDVARVAKALSLIARYKDTKLGDIYFIRAGDSLKIGYSKDPGKRLKQLQTGCPAACEIITTVPGPQRLEEELHQLFAFEQINGEWFRISPSIKALIQSLLSTEPVAPDASHSGLVDLRDSCITALRR